MAAAGWLTPDWPAPAGVHATCTTRSGGVSAGAYESLNLGDHVGDEPAFVATNRKIFEDSISARPVFLAQVHGASVAGIDRSTAHGLEADACVAVERGVACTIMVADCLPILLATKDGRAVAAAHAGWRGLAGAGGHGIVEAVGARLLEQTKAAPADVIAWLGPCIGPAAFEVGDDVKAAFTRTDAGASRHFKPCRDAKWLADLPGLARMRLEAFGIRSIHGNDGSEPWCTVSNPSRFFSHRRDRSSGRFAAAVWLA